MRDFDVQNKLMNHYVWWEMCGDFDLYFRPLFPARERMWYKTISILCKQDIHERGFIMSREFTSKWKSR